MAEWRQFHFRIDKRSTTIDSYYPSEAKRAGLVREEEFDSVISHINSLLKKPRRMQKRMNGYRIATYATCICILGLVVFLPIMIRYTDLYLQSLGRSFNDIHRYFKRINKTRSRVRWKIVKRYKDLSQLGYAPRPFSVSWWDKEHPIIENYEREEYVVVLQLAKGSK